MALLEEACLPALALCDAVLGLLEVELFRRVSALSASDGARVFPEADDDDDDDPRDDEVGDNREDLTEEED